MTKLPILPSGGSDASTGDEVRYPSIFNDVIGPVMRGPSSSHCAAAVRIGLLARALMDGEMTEVLVEFHPTGSLATTHESQGSDMGLFGGLLGWDATDDRLVDSPRAIRAAGIETEIRITEFPASHPNTYRITLRHGAEEHRMTALSLGGGMIRVVEVDGVALSMEGDYHETLLFLAGSGVAEVGRVLEEGGVHADSTQELSGLEQALIQIKSQDPIPPETLSRLLAIPQVLSVRTLPPVLPVQSRVDMQVPFLSATQMEAFALQAEKGGAQPLPLWRLAAAYESQRGGIPEEEVLARMVEIVEILETSLQTGLAGTEYEDRILEAQVGSFRSALGAGALLGAEPRDAGLLNTMILYVTAFMETKSAMGVIVAAPTAGACATLPASCLSAAHHLAGVPIGEGLPSSAAKEEAAKAMLAAGMIGVFIAAHSTFAAEVCGCQAETGAGAGMAAAALVHLGGGTAQQALAASSMALQNTLGLICDPVANRVEVPCLGRNVLGASNALASANMALAGFDPVIPLDEVIQTMDAVGKSLPHSLRCTALGGLSVTPASKRIEEALKAKGSQGAGIR
jgi:L-serine dehydratase